ncbi:MAG: hypothetical protein KGJ90_06800 [Patescibacteria group bacterium]|nr:hypothetical protein [Patescibacteria group bacterium]
MSRDAGFYWVKYAGEWQPASFVMGYRKSYWYLIDSDGYYNDDEFDEIGERIERKES